MIKDTGHTCIRKRIAIVHPRDCIHPEPLARFTHALREDLGFEVEIVKNHHEGMYATEAAWVKDNANMEKEISDLSAKLVFHFLYLAERDVMRASASVSIAANSAKFRGKISAPALHHFSRVIKELESNFIRLIRQEERTYEGEDGLQMEFNKGPYWFLPEDHPARITDEAKRRVSFHHIVSKEERDHVAEHTTFDYIDVPEGVYSKHKLETDRFTVWGGGDLEADKKEIEKALNEYKALST